MSLDAAKNFASRCLHSIISVKSPVMGKDVLFKTVTLLNLVKKAYFFFTNKESSYLTWPFGECLVKAKFHDIDYLFVCPRKRDFNVFLNPFFHEYDITSFVYQHLRENDVFIDVGAHGGLYTLIASKRVGKKGTVISVEPNPENLRYLLMNVKLNKLENVEIISKAVADKEKNLKLWYNQSETALTSFKKTPLQSSSFNIQATTIDIIAKNFSHIAMLKIDTEGFDIHVLEGAKETLPKTQYVILEQNTDKTKSFLDCYDFKVASLLPSNYLLATNRVIS